MSFERKKCEESDPRIMYKFNRGKGILLVFLAVVKSEMRQPASVAHTIQLSF